MSEREDFIDQVLDVLAPLQGCEIELLEIKIERLEKSASLEDRSIAEMVKRGMKMFSDFEKKLERDK